MSKFFLKSLLIIFISCTSSSNDKLIVQKNSDYNQLIFHIDSVINGNKYLSKDFQLYNDSIYYTDIIFRLNDNKIYIKPLDNQSKEFIFIKLNSNIGQIEEMNLLNKKIVKYKLVNNFKDSINNEIKEFEIYNWGKTDSIFGNIPYNLNLFISNDNEIIGNYFHFIERNKKLIFNNVGNIFEGKLDKQKVRKVEFL